ncbi:nitroreductase family protein [Mycobacterium sp. NAZ190054]|uniref:nitroreductase family protein n=1 Tax=Mycobacterium sp. NAZ190054 TaxID=1747766 RepID=UPI00079AE4A7|nr:nitroreductase family protein [Mycobacterium sp. NAZ190054]KWX68738.1 nitroreductase [Mycobacterium sp. NAZ190054]
MPAVPADRSADTSVPIHAPIAQRWSPRAFDPAAELSRDDLTALLEAARWAPTWGGRQPIRFVVGLRTDVTFTTIAALLRRGNSYATAASALILLCADDGEDEKTQRYAAVDAGAAMANITIEAVSRGLIAHPMAGFDVTGAGEAFALPAGLRPLMVIAVGRLGDHAAVAPEIAERDLRPRRRLPLDEIVLNRNR